MLLDEPGDFEAGGRHEGKSQAESRGIGASAAHCERVVKKTLARCFAFFGLLVCWTITALRNTVGRRGFVYNCSLCASSTYCCLWGVIYREASVEGIHLSDLVTGGFEHIIRLQYLNCLSALIIPAFPSLRCFRSTCFASSTLSRAYGHGNLGLHG